MSLFYGFLFQYAIIQCTLNHAVNLQMHCRLFNIITQVTEKKKKVLPK